MDSTDNEIWTELTKNIKPLKKEAHDTERPLPKFKITPKITANTAVTGLKIWKSDKMQILTQKLFVVLKTENSRPKLNLICTDVRKIKLLIRL